MDCHAKHHKYDTYDICCTGYLVQDDDSNHCRGRRQEREQEREARAWQSRHGELIAHIGNHRRAESDADPGEQAPLPVEAASSLPTLQLQPLLLLAQCPWKLLALVVSLLLVDSALPLRQQQPLVPWRPL